MFAKKDNKPRITESAAPTINIIGVGTQITGDVVSAGDIRIDGSINGKVLSKAKVVIGASCTVHGDIEAQNADISGNVIGKVIVSETLFLKSSANIKGDIAVNKLVVESGAEFNGNCTMRTTERVAAPENVIQQNGKRPHAQTTEA